MLSGSVSCGGCDFALFRNTNCNMLAWRSRIRGRHRETKEQISIGDTQHATSEVYIVGIILDYYIPGFLARPARCIELYHCAFVANAVTRSDYVLRVDLLSISHHAMYQAPNKAMRQTDLHRPSISSTRVPSSVCVDVRGTYGSCQFSP